MMAGILFPAFQKFYSAVCSLESFDKENDFFDNISNLDKFFSEYRNITFVMQKSLKHTEYMSLYKEYRDKYLTDKWFIEKRNEITKEQPFQLHKEIEITVYFPSKTRHLYSKEFTVENDLKLDSIINSIKELLLQISTIEVFFSAKYIFYEKDKNDNVLLKCMDGIHKMTEFMNAMYNGIAIKCNLCDEIIKKINKFKFVNTPQDMLMIDDYVYYPQKKVFNRAQRFTATFGSSVFKQRMPLSKFGSFLIMSKNDYFKKFISLNVMLKSTDLMSTIMIVYKDNTYTMDLFQANIKTTFYRKINEVAQMVLEGNIKEIYFMTIYSWLPESKYNREMTSKERVEKSEEDILVFMKMCSNLEEEEYIFYGKELKNISYIVNQLKNGKKDHLEIGKINMIPIINAFKICKDKI